jgi:hypothetical protein
MEAIRQAVTDPDFAVPAPADTRFNIKKGFYRLPQFVVKGLAWYYNIDAVSSSDQITDLVAANRMHLNKATVFRRALDAPLRMRVGAQLSSGKEHDYVRAAAHAGPNPDNETVLTVGELADLHPAIGDLQNVRTWSLAVRLPKTTVAGARGTPVTAP